MTEEQIKALVAEASKAAAAEAAKATAAEITAAYDAKLEAQRVDFDKRLAAATAKAPEPKPNAKAGEVTPEVAALQESNAALLKKFEESEARSAQIARAAREKETDAAIAQHLQANGIKPETIPAVSLLLKRQIAEREDGTVVFKGKHPTTGLPGEFDIADGVKTWAASPDAAHYKAPRGVQGSGDRAGNSDPNQGQTFASLDDFYKQPT